MKKTTIVAYIVALLYLLLQIIPFGQEIENTKFFKKDKTLVFAHGGAKLLYPENTIYAFKRVLKYPIDGIEVDLRLTKDLKLVSIHDETIDAYTKAESDERFQPIGNYLSGNALNGYATEQWVEGQGYLTEHQDISHLATKAELPTVPTKVSELENDSKFITIDEVPEVTVPTKTSELTNDSGFITIEDVPVLEIPEEYVTETELNDKGFLTEHQDISGKQDVISDLATIRSGAEKGATALQSVPSEYVTETELTAKGYATTTQLNAKQDTISDLGTIRTNASNGATAYGWGNHAIAGYAKSSDLNSKANSSDLTSHTGNKSNPHGVTLSQLGVNASSAELNYLSGTTSNVQSQFNDLSAKLEKKAAKAAKKAEKAGGK